MENAFSVTLTMSLLHEGYVFQKISSAIRLINLECVSNVWAIITIITNKKNALSEFQVAFMTKKESAVHAKLLLLLAMVNVLLMDVKLLEMMAANNVVTLSSWLQTKLVK
mgnify:FL=1